MGCDIHVTLEQKEYETWWGLGSNMNPGRNYGTFAKLAGIRGDGPEPKGLPDNMSWETKEALEEGDDHSHSWSTVKEWEEAIDDEPEYQAILAAAKTLQSHGRETRIVFWFDN